MNKTLITIALAAIGLTLAATACSDDPTYSVVPVFDAITCQPDMPSPGDSITITAHQSVHGKLIYSATYKWSITYFDNEAQRDTTVRMQRETVYDADGGDIDPQIGFRLPADTPSKSLIVTINASYGLSAQTEMGQIFGQAIKTATLAIK